MKRRKEVITYIFIIVLLLININNVDANFLDIAREYITGEATQTKHAQLQILNDPPSINPASIDVDDDGITPFDNDVAIPPDNTAYPVYVTFAVSDPDGASEVDVTNGATVTITFSKTGEDSRVGTCTGAPTLAGNTATYDGTDCSVNMKYYDAFSLWDVTITVEDSDPQLASDTETEINAFTVQKTTSFAIQSPATLDWGIVALSITNQLSLAPAVLRDNGNDPGDKVQVTGRNLLGTTDSTRGILTTDFSVNPSAICPTSPNLILGTPVDVIIAVGNALPVGSDASPSPTQNLNFCLEQITNPGVSGNTITKQTYSTAVGGTSPWDVILVQSV